MEATQNEAQQAFTAKMQAKHITPLWTISNRIVMREPTPKIPPVFWNYQRDIRPHILEAAEIITAAEAHRRVLVLNNPTLKHGATHTLTCAIQAIKEAGLAPGTDILVVSIDAVPDIFQAIAAGEANATVELTPNMAGPAFDALEAYWADGTMPEKFIQTESRLYTQADDPQAVYDSKKDLGY